jgi:serine/threonine-protein kinase HipA
LEDSQGDLWFGTKRFDRGPNNSRLHSHTVAGLTHANFRLPSIDYEDILKITAILTKSEDCILSAFRLAAFNVIFHNRDDHAKNFSFIMNPQGVWRFAPAYDLTFCAGPGGEHMTAVLGEGKHPTRKSLLDLANKSHIKAKTASEIVDQVESGIMFMKDLMVQYQIKNSHLKGHLKSPHLG